MIKFALDKIDLAFRRNLIDWAAGGPKDGGYTRVADPIYVPHYHITKMLTRKKIHVDDVLAKNFPEVHRWHMNFLKSYKKYGWESWKDTAYYDEYLCSRYNAEDAEERAKSFVDLYDDVKVKGIWKPVYLADVERTNFGFRYFRFDGCHRTCVCKALGIQRVIALLFLISGGSPTHCEASKYSPTKSSE